MRQPTEHVMITQFERDAMILLQICLPGDELVKPMQGPRLKPRILTRI